MSFRRTAAVTVAIAALALMGCGSNENSLSPDTAPPLTPTAIRVQTGKGKVSLNWNHNSEADLAGYNIYLGGRAGAILLNDGVVSENHFVMVPGADGTYRFRITAVDRAGNESAPSPALLVEVTIPAPREPGNSEGLSRVH